MCLFSEDMLEKEMFPFENENLSSSPKVCLFRILWIKTSEGNHHRLNGSEEIGEEETAIVLDPLQTCSENMMEKVL